MVADEGCQDQDRARRGIGEADAGRELRRREPPGVGNRQSLDKRQRCLPAAKCQRADDQKAAEQLKHLPSPGRFRSR
jgi:hypothetical protein